MPRPTPAARAGSVPWRRSYPVQLVELLTHPDRALPQLTEQQGALSLLGFPAVSGMFVAYMLARGLALGDSFGFLPVVLGVVGGGALLGMLALWFAGTLPNWSVLNPDAADRENARMFVIFSDATWPFLPALAIMAGLEFTYYGTTAFSATRAGAPGWVFWLTHGAAVVAIALWLTMMVRATAVARHESASRAAGELTRWGAELVAIAVLLLLILAASVMYW